MRRLVDRVPRGDGVAGQSERQAVRPHRVLGGTPLARVHRFVPIGIIAAGHVVREDEASPRAGPRCHALQPLPQLRGPRVRLDVRTADLHDVHLAFALEEELVQLRMEPVPRLVITGQQYLVPRKVEQVILRNDEGVARGLGEAGP